MASNEGLIDRDRQHHVHGQTNLRHHQEHGPVAMVTEGHGVFIRTEVAHEQSGTGA